MNISLRPFQERALKQFRVAWAGPKGAKLGIAPTAFGKSILMGYLAHQLCPKGWRVVILAHREALVEQNANKVLKVDPNLVVGKEIAKERAPAGCDVVSASIATLKGERMVECVARWREDGRKILLCTDEAHHALADSYLHFFTALDPDEHLGLTATPYRGDGESLSMVYPVVGFEVKRAEMIDDGWLARPHHFRVQTSASLRNVKTRAGEYDQSGLAKAIDTSDRNALVVAAANDAKSYLKGILEQPIPRAVCFTLDVAHTHAMAKLFAEAGWEAYAIDGKTPIPDRRHADARLRSATAPVVLVSCGVLTEGWDVEECNLGLFARPTKSPVLADQMLGRVLRWLEAKPGALVVDFDDADSNGRITIASTFKLPTGWDAQGECLRTDERWFSEALSKVPIRTASALWDCTCRDEVTAILSNPDATKGHRLGREYLWWVLGQEAHMVVDDASIVVAYTPQGDLVAQWRHGLERVELAAGYAMDKVCGEAEMWLDMHHPTHSHYLRAKENFTPASEKQLELLGRWGLKVPEGVTKYEAGLLINQAKAERNAQSAAGIITIGKYKGLHVNMVPTYYLEFMTTNGEQAWFKARPEYQLFMQELTKRSGGLQI